MYTSGLFDQSEWGLPPSVRGYSDKLHFRFSEDLAALHERLRDLLERRRNLERDLQIQYSEDLASSSNSADFSSDAPSLTLRTNPAQGMHVHIGRAKRDDAKVKNDLSFVSISDSASTSSYFYQVCSLCNPFIRILQVFRSLGQNWEAKSQKPRLPWRMQKRKFSTLCAMKFVPDTFLSNTGSLYPFFSF